MRSCCATASAGSSQTLRCRRSSRPAAPALHRATARTTPSARCRLDGGITPITRTERVLLVSAGWRVAAEDIVSDIDVPPFARSAMDGYAVIAADIESASERAPVALQIIEQLYTGRAPSQTV